MKTTDTKSFTMDIIEWIQANYLEEEFYGHLGEYTFTDAQKQEIFSMFYNAMDKAYHEVDVA